MTAYKWQFASRFKYQAFGWNSDKPIQRIKEALSEIKQVAKNDPEWAAAGAVLFLEKLSPALEQVDRCQVVFKHTILQAEYYRLLGFLEQQTRSFNIGL